MIYKLPFCFLRWRKSLTGIGTKAFSINLPSIKFRKIIEYFSQNKLFKPKSTTASRLLKATITHTQMYCTLTLFQNIDLQCALVSLLQIYLILNVLNDRLAEARLLIRRSSCFFTIKIKFM